jgi:hypothetical protein
MTSEKAYSVEARLDALLADTSGALFGPWTDISPLSNGWAVQSPFTGAWVRAAPGNMAIISFRLNCASATKTNGTTVGTIPATDADGNNLRPAQAVVFPVATDSSALSVSPNDEGARFTIASTGVITCNGFAAGASCTVGHNSGHWYPLDAM